MILPQRWQSRTALTLAMAMTSTAAMPFLMAKSAVASDSYRIAQVFPQEWRTPSSPAPIPSAPPSRYPSNPSRYPSNPATFPTVQSSRVVPAGTVIPMTYDKEKIVVTPDETVPVTLKTAVDVRTATGTVLIPAGSEVKGELQPSGDGTQFVAQETILDGESVSINALSNVITRREIISKKSDPRILEGAAIGGAAAAILSEIFGRIDIWEVIGGAGLGALASVLIRNQEEVEVIVVEPETDLALRLQSNLSLE